MPLVEAKPNPTAETEYCYHRVALEEMLAAFEAVRLFSERDVAVGVELLGLTRAFEKKLEAFLGELQHRNEEWARKVRDRNGDEPVG